MGHAHARDMQTLGCKVLVRSVRNWLRLPLHFPCFLSDNAKVTHGGGAGLHGLTAGGDEIRTLGPRSSTSLMNGSREPQSSQTGASPLQAHSTRQRYSVPVRALRISAPTALMSTVAAPGIFSLAR